MARTITLASWMLPIALIQTWSPPPRRLSNSYSTSTWARSSPLPKGPRHPTRGRRTPPGRMKITAISSTSSKLSKEETHCDSQTHVSHRFVLRFAPHGGRLLCRRWYRSKGMENQNRHPHLSGRRPGAEPLVLFWPPISGRARACLPLPHVRHSDGQESRQDLHHRQIGRASCTERG